MEENLKIKFTTFKSNFATSKGGKAYSDDGILRHYKSVQNNSVANFIQSGFIWGSTCKN